ncbi:hypothetical protein WJX74_002735 [Apatococcus lobatus]|uniref:Uncharacterized protein n=1 Tax=Apatococcus lobatus TaxID=904363 RepID=A0AAW1QDN9_9CHLO
MASSQALHDHGSHGVQAAAQEAGPQYDAALLQKQQAQSASQQQSQQHQDHPAPIEATEDWSNNIVQQVPKAEMMKLQDAHANHPDEILNHQTAGQHAQHVLQQQSDQQQGPLMSQGSQHHHSPHTAPELADHEREDEFTFADLQAWRKDLYSLAWAQDTNTLKKHVHKCLADPAGHACRAAISRGQSRVKCAGLFTLLMAPLWFLDGFCHDSLGIYTSTSSAGPRCLLMNVGSAFILGFVPLSIWRLWILWGALPTTFMKSEPFTDLLLGVALDLMTVLTFLVRDRAVGCCICPGFGSLSSASITCSCPLSLSLQPFALFATLESSYQGARARFTTAAAKFRPAEQDVSQGISTRHLCYHRRWGFLEIWDPVCRRVKSSSSKCSQSAGLDVSLPQRHHPGTRAKKLAAPAADLRPLAFRQDALLETAPASASRRQYISAKEKSRGLIRQGQSNQALSREEANIHSKFKSQRCSPKAAPSALDLEQDASSQAAPASDFIEHVSAKSPAKKPKQVWNVHGSEPSEPKAGTSGEIKQPSFLVPASAPELMQEFSHLKEAMPSKAAPSHMGPRKSKRPQQEQNKLLTASPAATANLQHSSSRSRQPKAAVQAGPCATAKSPACTSLIYSPAISAEACEKYSNQDVFSSRAGLSIPALHHSETSSTTPSHHAAGWHKVSKRSPALHPSSISRLDATSSSATKTSMSATCQPPVNRPNSIAALAKPPSAAETSEPDACLDQEAECKPSRKAPASINFSRIATNVRNDPDITEGVTPITSHVAIPQHRPQPRSASLYCVKPEATRLTADKLSAGSERQASSRAAHAAITTMSSPPSKYSSDGVYEQLHEPKKGLGSADQEVAGDSSFLLTGSAQHTCITCEQAARQTLFAPCGHMLFCG